MTIEYVAPSPGEYPSLTEEAAGKGLKSILGFALTMFIPVVGPWLGAALRTSMSLGAGWATAANVAGGAIAGWAGARLQGQSGTRGALMGGIGGFLGGGGLKTQGGGQTFGGNGLDTTAGSTGTDTILGNATRGTPFNPSVPTDFAGAPLPVGTPTMSLGERAMQAAGQLGQSALKFAQTERGGQLITMAALGLVDKPTNLEALVAARRQELDAMQQADMAQYQRIQAQAQELVNAANQRDPYHAGLDAATQTRLASEQAGIADEREQAANNAYGVGRRANDQRRRRLGAAAAGIGNFHLAADRARETQTGLRTAAFGALNQYQPRVASDAAYGLAADEAAANEERRRQAAQLAGLAYGAFINPKYQGPTSPGFTGG